MFGRIILFKYFCVISFTSTFFFMVINSVVVTYNRLSLLKENIAALKAQTYPVHAIFVINNCSTDGTKEYLQDFADDRQVVVFNLEKNLGGAGGFSKGIKEAVMSGCDYVWLMDDDTIPTPTALEALMEVNKITTSPIGFACSKVVWTDGSQHQMNKVSLKYQNGLKTPITYQTDVPNIYLCRNCTFVSVLISSSAVYELGLPISEFFIWHDDIEYTERISSHNYLCFFVQDSVVLHKTAINYAAHPDIAPPETAWKFYYQARNTTYMKRMKEKNKFFFYFSMLNKYRIYMHRIGKRKDGNGQLFKDAIRKGCLDGLKFAPVIEYLPRK